eukprot:Pgem_evm1s6772
MKSKVSQYLKLDRKNSKNSNLSRFDGFYRIFLTLTQPQPLPVLHNGSMKSKRIFQQEYHPLSSFPFEKCYVGQLTVRGQQMQYATGQYLA